MELAETAADELTQRLKERHDVIRDAFEEGGGRFFRRNGLLFLPEPKLAETLRQLSGSAPLLGTLALDPSLRGVMDSISLSLRGVQFHRITLESLAPQFRAFTEPIQHVLNRQPAFFSWRKLLNT
ncbi:MAG: hopanoid biosynthesis-associated RND transporter HpnN, partial [Rhodomicrobium sp.]